MSARGRARADAQGRCDGVGSEEIGLSEPSRTLRSVPGGFLVSAPVPLRDYLKPAHFFGEAPERRPWAIKREDRPAAFAGRSKSRLSWSLWPSGYRRCLYRQVSYPTRIICRQLQRATPAGNLRNQPEIIVRTSGATTAAHYIFLEQAHYASSTINLRLAAVRRLAYKAADAGLLSPDLAAGIRRVKGAKKFGVRIGD